MLLKFVADRLVQLRTGFNQGYQKSHIESKTSCAKHAAGDEGLERWGSGECKNIAKSGCCVDD